MYVRTVSKTRLKFSNSKIAYINTLNNLFVFFSKKYVKKKFQEKKFGPFLKKLWAKNRNSISFKQVIKKISKFTRKSFLVGTKKCQKMKEIKN